MRIVSHPRTRAFSLELRPTPLTPPLGTLAAADSAAWPARSQLAPTQPPPPISSLTSRQAWVAGCCRQPATAASRAALERLPLYLASCGRRRADALEISTARAVTCLRPRPGNGVRLLGKVPDDLPLRGGSQRTQPRLEPSAHRPCALQPMPREPLSRRPGDLSCSCSSYPCPLADEPCFLTLLAGLVHWQRPAADRPQRAERMRALSHARALLQPAAHASSRREGLARGRVRLARRACGGPCAHSQRASIAAGLGP